MLPRLALLPRYQTEPPSPSRSTFDDQPRSEGKVARSGNGQPTSTGAAWVTGSRLPPILRERSISQQHVRTLRDALRFPRSLCISAGGQIVQATGGDQPANVRCSSSRLVIPSATRRMPSVRWVVMFSSRASALRVAASAPAANASLILSVNSSTSIITVRP